MIKMNKDKLKELANDLLFDMADQEYDTLLKEFDELIALMDLLGEIPNVDRGEPMIFPFAVTNTYLREDEAGTPLTKEEFLSNTPDSFAGQVRLPKVVN
ncbi:MAG TPA: Asp-tRNA(Asn)/Glu-tRNA(Gln) amidotransferase GatCAB subunit C [Bacilli bacterium]|nr:Asp-tRNA(Asn)/Glu-tRNA(Gln) amidotransferase GatCAB subunit C [Bacilli bacterium]